MSEPSNAPDVYRAIAYVTEMLSHDGVGKDAKNEKQGYKFRSIDAVMNALSAPLATAGLCILPRVTERVSSERPTANGGVLFTVTLCVDFEFVSAKDGSKHVVTLYSEGMDSADKATNKAMQAAYKYACIQVFCIPTEGMEDADAQTPEPKHQPAPRPASQPKPPTASGLKPVKGSEEERRLRELIQTTLLKLREKYIAAGAEGDYVEVLGAHGYMDSSEVPVDTTIANRVCNDLKIRLHDIASARVATK